MKIEKHIAKLLREFDCVIIPGLGGFVANYSPSQYNRAKGLLIPPSKAVIFNRNLINNDGLLINHVATTENISYQEASNFVNEFTIHCKNELRSGKRVEFSELGVLYEDAELILQFRPEFSINFLTESFGLFPIVAKELVQSIKAIEIVKPIEETSTSTNTTKEIILPKVEKVEVKEAEKIERTLKQEIRTSEKENSSEPKVLPIKKKRKTGRYILAAAVAIPVIFYSVWIPLKTGVMDTGVIEVADLNPFRSPKPDKTYQPNNEESSLGNVKDIMPSFEESASEEPIFETIDPSEIDTTLVDHSNNISHQNVSSNQYHIIAGCFREDENANRMVEYLKSKGYDAYVLDTVNGLKRVTAASYANIGDAVSQLRDLRNHQIAEAWLLNLK